MQLKDAIKVHNKASQEIVLNLLNQMKNTNTKIDNIRSKKTVVPKYSFPIKSPTMDEKTQNDEKIFRSFTTDIEAPDGLPPTPNKLPANFYEFMCKHHELQLNKYIGSSKSD